MVHTVWSPGYGTRYMIYPIMWALALIPVSILQSAQLPQEDQHPWVLQYFALIKLSSYFAVSYEHVLLRSSVPLPHVFEHIPDHSPHSLELSVHPEVTIFESKILTNLIPSDIVKSAFKVPDSAFSGIKPWIRIASCVNERYEFKSGFV